MLILFMKNQFQMEFAKNFTSALFSVFKPNYLENLRGYPQFSFWILIALGNIYSLAQSSARQNYFVISRHRP